MKQLKDGLYEFEYYRLFNIDFIKYSFHRNFVRETVDIKPRLTFLRRNSTVILNWLEDNSPIRKLKGLKFIL